MHYIINGIQQIGLGVADAKEVFNWYRKNLGFDILVFEDESPARLMTRYTGDTVQERYALLALNMKGGGGLEIWQFTGREPKAPETQIRLGDLGINAMKVRCNDIKGVYAELKERQLPLLSELVQHPDLTFHFFFKDPWNNLVEVVSDSYEFCQTNAKCGGVLGAVIGVSDMEKSIQFYQKILAYDIIVSDRTGTFDEFECLSQEQGSFRRVLLKHSSRSVGGFGELLGPSEIELIQVLGDIPKRIYENRFWGDLGYIHLCFDIRGMKAFQDNASELNYPFTVDSADSFDMGEAAGHFGYIEDPDGTLIELVETHRVPILKKLGLYINLKKRSPGKPLSKWLIKMMRVHRVSKNL